MGHSRRLRVYADYNATAPVRPEVRRAVEPILFGPESVGAFGNASSVHWAGRQAKKHLEDARRRIAAIVGRAPGDVVFTSGGTEADNLALRGLLRRGDRLAISSVEHPAVVQAAADLATRGVDVVRIPVDDEGRLDLDALDDALQTPTTLVSVMAVNNETGVVFPIDEVVERAHAAGALVHVDAVQAAGRLALPREADLLTLSGHKLGGLVGAGALVCPAAITIEPQLRGGAQERGRRAGTESVAAALALAIALERAEAERDAESLRLSALRDELEAAIAEIDGSRILGGRAERVPQTVTALFSGLEGESLLQALDLAGIAASSGSACSSGSLEPSHVLTAMGIPAAQTLSAVRLSFGWATTREQVERICEVLAGLVARARA